MDLSGVPQKINRHVIKALTQNAKEGLKFGEILVYVRLCNRNLKPVTNLQQTVHKSLKNFEKIGLILRDDKARYKIVSFAIPRDRNIDTGTHTSPQTSRSIAQKRSISPISQNKASFVPLRVISEECDLPIKRRKCQKNTIRLKRDKNLSKNRKPFAERLNLESNIDLFSDNEISRSINYEDESYLREPGSDDRDSGDGLCIKASSTKNDQDKDDTEEKNNETENKILGTDEENNEKNVE